MNNVLCIFPKDCTTEFLNPVYEEIISIYTAKGLLGDPTEDDEYLEKLSYEASRADSIIFLGHGSSKSLYGLNFNEIICKENENIDIFRGKRIILFACKSIDFIRHFKFNNAIGFGLMPTSTFDTQPGKIFHNLPIGELSVEDLGYIQDCIVRIWQNSLRESDIFEVRKFYNSFSFHTNVEIVNCLLNNKSSTNYRLVADVLYYLKEDMDYVP